MTAPSATEADVEVGTRLLQLAERCEREPPSPDLYYQIEWAISEYRNEGGGWRTHKVTGLGERFNYTSSPPWLTSIDAAASLVPEHYSWELTFSAAGKGALRRARLWDWRRSPRALDPDNEWSSETKSSPAAALCAAALRARAALGEAGGKEEG